MTSSLADASLASSPPTASARAPASAPSSTATAIAIDDEADARARVMAWSDALDRHDLAALAGIYADRVDLYGRSLSRDAVIAAKARAFAATPSFRQSIEGPIAITREGRAFTARFQKRSGAAGRTSVVEARVVVTGDRVIVETDAPSVERARPKGCEELVAAIVRDLPGVKRALESDERAVSSRSDANVGGIGPEPDPDGGFTMGLGIFTPERFEAHVWYSVDGRGKLTVTIFGEDQPISEAASARAKAACAK